MSTITVAAIAVATVEGLVDANYQRAIRLAEISLQQQPDIILLPEAFAAGYCSADLTPYGEDVQHSRYLQQFRRISREGACMVVVGYLETVAHGVKNAVAVFDRGELLGTHYKSSLWPDDARPYRDERALLVPGETIEVFDTRFGPMAVLICYENMLEANWRAVTPAAAFVLSPYNCQGDPSHNNVKFAKLLGIPSAWADRTGTVFCGDGYAPNPGTAGLVDAQGNVLAISQPGVEAIIVGEIVV